MAYTEEITVDVGSFNGSVRADACDGFTTIAAAGDHDGVVKGLFRKELIKIGDYVKASTGQKFTVDAALLSHWAATFSEMAKNGVVVPIPSTHAGAGDPDKARGRVKTLFVDGDSLIMTCELIGEDAIAAAERNDVSIHSPPEFTDGKGNMYQQPITHVALTPEPLVPGLSEFISIAASLRLELSQMYMKGLAKLLGIEGDVDPGNAEAKFGSAIKKLQSRLADAEKKVKTVSASRDDSTGDPKDEGKDDPKPKGPPKVAPMMLTLAIENRSMRLDRLLEAGRIDRATRDKLAEQYVSDETLTLTLASETKDADGFDRLMETLRHNQPVILGEHTGEQTITMADGSKRSGDDVLLIDAEQRAAAFAQ